MPWLAGYPREKVEWFPTIDESKCVSCGMCMNCGKKVYDWANGPKGKPVADRGKYVTIWRKQPDGKWKVVADILNSDLPVPGAAKH